MRKIFAILFVVVLVLSFSVFQAEAAKDSSELLKDGLLGAGAGAVGGAASGADGGDLWKGALAGAGVNIVGGALLDSITGEKVRRVSTVDPKHPQDAYSDGYTDGFNNGFKQGFVEGYREGMRDAQNTKGR